MGGRPTKRGDATSCLETPVSSARPHCPRLVSTTLGVARTWRLASHEQTLAHVMRGRGCGWAAERRDLCLAPSPSRLSFALREGGRHAVSCPAVRPRRRETEACSPQPAMARARLQPRESAWNQTLPQLSPEATTGCHLDRGPGEARSQRSHLSQPQIPEAREEGDSKRARLLTLGTFVIQP